MPSWQAQHNGPVTDLSATDASSALNQFLGAHAATSVYAGKQIVTPGSFSTTTGNDFFWITPTLINGIGDLNNNDVDWFFTLPGGSTTVGRIQAAMQPIGSGADIKVTLYPDSSGIPNLTTPLASTVVPASQLNNLGAASGLANGSAIATQANNVLLSGPFTETTWGTVSTSAVGLLTTTSFSAFGQFLGMFGGLDSNSGNPVTNVFTIPLTTGGAGQAIPQTALPQALSSIGPALTTDTAIMVGGTTASAAVTSVYTASYNSNTGTIGAWASQPALPVALYGVGVAVFNDSTVYAVGGYTGSAAVSTVYVGSLANQQINSWTASDPLPTAAFGQGVVVIGNILMVIGGVTSPTSAAINNVYWTTISPTGSLGQWNTGPNLPVAVGNIDGSLLVTDSGVFIMGGVTVNGVTPTLTKTLQSITVTANGVGTWQQQGYNGNSLNLPTGGFSNGDGTYTLASVGAISGGGFTTVQTIYTVPLISIPLPATGLTSGNVYHVVFQQIGGNVNNYVQLGEINNSTSEWFYSARRVNGTGPWLPRTGLSLMMNVSDLTTSNPLLHTWHDPDVNNTAALTTTSVYGFRNNLIGFCEATTINNGPLNSNPTFTSGVTPWTATNGTITQSNAQTHGGFPFSGLLTPTGGFTQAFALSELIPTVQTQWSTPSFYTATGWFYSPTGWASFALYLNWYDENKNFISTTGFTTALSAATWTQVTNHQQAPSTAAFVAMAVDEFNTPGATNTIFMSDVYLVLEDKNTLASQAVISYPTGTFWPPIGVTQLN